MKAFASRIALLVLLLLSGTSRAEPWKPASLPMATRWTKDVSPQNAWNAYPRPQLVRDQWQSLNGLWDYAVTPSAAAQPPTYAGQILVPFCIESALSGVRKTVTPREALWYRRSFEVPRAWSGQRILLHFDAVDWQATVWLNGKELVTHRGGYDRFTLDITAALAHGRQELVVRVWDPTGACFQDRNGGWPHQPFGKQYLGYLDCTHFSPVTGIWQTVWLEPLPAASIENLKVSPDLDAECVHLTVAAGGADAQSLVEAEVLEGAKTVASASGKPGATIRISLPRAKLWSPESPFLYGLKVRLKAASGTMDAVESYFGMRKVSLGKDQRGITRLMLNGKPVFHIGPLDQGYWPDGLYTAATDDALRADVELLKRLGFNTVRKHVKVEPDRWYYWCDKLGVMVWQDMVSTLPPAGAGRELRLSDRDERQFELELQRMVQQHINHPSIVMWVIFNETWGQFRSADLARAVKGWDPTRLVNAASGCQDVGAGDVKDGHQYAGPMPGPTPASPRATPTQWQWGVEVKPETGRAVALGEFGGCLRAVGGRTWNKAPNIGGFLRAGYPQYQDEESLTARYEEMLRGVVKLKEMGVSAAIYTSLADIEDEINGFVTYDRGVPKMNFDRVRAANRRVAELGIEESRF